MFTNAESDTPYQKVVYVTRARGDITGLILLAVAGLGLLVVAVVLVRRRGRHSRITP